MKRNFRLCCPLVMALTALTGCSSGPSESAKKAASAKDKIRGKAQILLAETSAIDSAMNAGGRSVYLWDGIHRYRLFLRTPFEIEGGKEYIAEGVNAQKLIDEIGDPDKGKNGYPLSTSCERAVKAAWPGLAFDVTDGLASTLRTRVKRYPARPVLLVTRIIPVDQEGETKPAEAKKVATGAADDDAPEINVPAEKQKALLKEGSVVQPAPLWEPNGGTAKCKVVIGTDGKVAELETGAQLCEAAPWESFRYEATTQKGRPVKVSTEVEIRFEPAK